VFFLLPGLVSVIFLSDFQADLLANLSNQAGAEKILDSMTGPMIWFGLLSFALQSVGYLALLALLTDRSRPTVGEALRLAVRALPTVLGAAVLFFAGYMGAVLLLAVAGAGLAKISGLGAIVAIAVIALIVGVVYAMVKFSLILPVVVIEQTFNPVTALARSWRLTKGNSARLLAFYLLLAVVYFVIIMVVTMIVMALAVAIAGQGKLSLLIGGVFSGVVGAAASVMLTAVLAAIHRQLAGPGPDALGSTFD
jgi:lysylphosphatidylglycerol synthetase-like protein (DUF2156 family)